MKINCQICDIEFKKSPSIIKKGFGKFCSKKCLGISQRNDLNGEKFGKWTVINFSHIKPHKNTPQSMWNVRCECGQEKEVWASSLKGGKSKSCGCDRYNKITKPFGESCLNDFFSHYKSAAKKRNIIFELDKEFFSLIVFKNCSYCGEDPKKRTNGRKSINGIIPLNGIDRKDNNIGYTVENCVPCCPKCNFMKMKLNDGEFLSQIEKIHHFQKHKGKEFPPSYLTVVA